VGCRRAQYRWFEGNAAMPNNNAVALDIAVERVEHEVCGFIQNPREPDFCFRVNGGEDLYYLLGGASVSALAVATGVGKTTVLVKQTVKLVRQMRAHGDTRKVVLLEPRHELAEEVAVKIREQGVSVTVLRGRDRDDPDSPGHTMCLDLAAVTDAQSVGEAVESSCCNSREQQCPFYDQCGYQRRKRSEPDVWIATHEYLSQDPSVFGEIAAVFIDESFWRAVTHELPRYHGQVTSNGLTQGEIDGVAGSWEEVEITKRRLVNALRLHLTPENLLPDGLIPVEQQLLQKEGLTVEACKGAEWAARKFAGSVDLYPGMTSKERAEAIKAFETAGARTKKHAGNLARMWEASADLLDQPHGSRSGRMFIRASDRSIHVQSGPNIHEGWRKIPTMLLDATLPPRDLLSNFFPRHKVIRQAPSITNVAMPLTRVRQVFKAKVSKNKLAVDENLQALRRYIARRFIETGRGKTMVIVQQKAADRLMEIGLPDGITLRHFNNLTGMNDGGDVRLLIVAGRTMPDPRSVELIAGTITGVMPIEASRTGNGSPWYDKLVQHVGNVCFDAYQHPDPVAEIVRWQICEAEVMQAIGRARAVRRGETGMPLQIDILADLKLPIVVDEAVTWDAVKVGRELAMLWAGIVILDSSRDMAACWPDVWRDTKSAENWRRDLTLPALVCNHLQGEGGLNQNRWKAIRYRLPGRGQGYRSAYYDQAIFDDIAAVRTWLESRLGTLSEFETI
jgi:putative DNA primase/helicase